MLGHRPVGISLASVGVVAEIRDVVGSFGVCGRFPGARSSLFTSVDVGLGFSVLCARPPRFGSSFLLVRVLRDPYFYALCGRLGHAEVFFQVDLFGYRQCVYFPTWHCLKKRSLAPPVATRAAA